ncbi:MAG TPA: hypothetical protein VF681_09685 [Abditibacteriaceae bacterium]
MEGEPGSGGGGNTPAPPADPLAALPAEQRTAIEAWATARINNEVNGLKNKNNELLGTVNGMKTELKKFEGFDPDVVNTILKKLGDDEEGALIKAGKIDEAFNKRTERLSKDWQKKVDGEMTLRTKAEQRAAKLVERATNQAIITEAAKSGAHPEAMEDIALRAKGAGWTINEDGDVVATKDGEVIFGKDGKTPLTVSEWIGELRSSAPHLWPRAQGSNANGNNGNRQGREIPSNLSPEARMTLAREQNASIGAR